MQMQFHADALDILKGAPYTTAPLSCASLLSGKCHSFQALPCAKSFTFGRSGSSCFLRPAHTYSHHLLVKELTSSY